VSGTSRGVSAATLRKAWESVTTNFGDPFRPSRRDEAPLFDDQTIGIAVEQVSDRLDLRQDQPALGASLSMGVTSTAISPARPDHQNGRGLVDELQRRRIEKGLPQVQYPLS